MRNIMILLGDQKLSPLALAPLLSVSVREANRECASHGRYAQSRTAVHFGGTIAKHVTHNEALRALDAVVQLTVLDRNLAAPPATPAEGDRYIIAASPTGAWAGHAGHITAFQDAAWLFYPPKEGWLTWIADENIAVAYDGAAWTSFSGGATTFLGLTDTPAAYTGAGSKLVKVNAGATALEFNDQVPLLGVNATPDATNKLAVSSAAALFNHAGNGHQVKVNKNAAADTASFLFQTAFSGRAEVGTTGDDSFHFKVSPDGTTFKEALILDKTTGAVAHLAGARATFAHDATNAGLNVVPAVGDPSAPANGDIWYNSTAAKFRKRENGATSDLDTVGAAGEVNTASNVNAGGIGVFKQKTGVNLEFRGINAGSTKVTVTSDTVNNEIDIDVAEASLTLGNLGGSVDLGGAKASGTLAAARFPALTGDVTTTAGSLAATIATNAVTNAKAAQMAANTLKGNNTGATANAADLTAGQAKALLAVAPADLSGLGAGVATWLATPSSANLAAAITVGGPGLWHLAQSCNAGARRRDVLDLGGDHRRDKRAGARAADVGFQRGHYGGQQSFGRNAADGDGGAAHRGGEQGRQRDRGLSGERRYDRWAGGQCVDPGAGLGRHGV